ncbi:hypothetical protein GCM10009840_24940 [Pseudolysinimonas kribbensis]|uniref:HTH hxlR-type domain-containing protein n=1 Tax=Pseudolysinimonas kribbensis TaxID=433641 RepID=A0ABQ6KEL4_9MICO|nr:helix-turn-helix domain-containing protein [Pseudolysinimonas kribbensis]GMA96726.1 hypothetical protein GCM10025881_35500 [Pseudolysinimonas kribbensis]
MTSLPADAAPDPGFEQIDDALCRAFQAHLEVVGRRWNSAILLAGARGATRFSEYRAMVTGISDRLLAQRLTELQREGLIVRTIVPTTPVQVRYRLTERGRSLMRVLQPIVRWGIDETDAERPRLHEVSG